MPTNARGGQRLGQKIRSALRNRFVRRTCDASFLEGETKRENDTRWFVDCSNQHDCRCLELSFNVHLRRPRREAFSLCGINIYTQHTSVSLIVEYSGQSMILFGYDATADAKINAKVNDLPIA